MKLCQLKEEHEPPDDEGAASSHQVPLSRAIREVPEPHLPDPADQRAHILQGHLPHASWCTVCVKSRARDDPHEHKPLALKLSNEVGAPPLIEMDYTFVEQLKILNLTWTNESISAAIVVASKGPERYPVAWVMKRVQKWGLKSIRIRTDAENSIMALAKAVAASYPEKVLLEVAPVQSHQSMGQVERAHRLLQEQLRVNRFELE